MRCGQLLAIALSVLCSFPAFGDVAKALQYGPYWNLNYGKWDDGRTYCELVGSWKKGEDFSLVATSYGASIALFSKNWDLPTGIPISVGIQFDGKYSYVVRFERIGNKLIAFSLRDDPVLWKRLALLFANSRKMRIAFPNGEILLADLSRTREAMQGWERCSAEWAGIDVKVLDGASGPASTASAPGASSPQPSPTAKEEAGGSGTGIVVSADGIIATNHHVVDGCRKVTVQSEEKVLGAEIIATDKTNDLAALRVRNTFNTVAGFSSQQIPLGSRVAAFGYPLYGALTSTGNFSIGYVSGLAGLGDDSRFVQISAPVQPGNSGGPLVDGKGRLVGVVASKLNAMRVAAITGDIPQNVNFAIKVDLLRYFLDANRIKMTTSRSDKELSDTELAALADSISVLVRCEGKP